MRAVDAYGVGVRFQRATVPQQVLDDPLTVKAEPGDLFLFNSEFFQCANRHRTARAGTRALMLLSFESLAYAVTRRES